MEIKVEKGIKITPKMELLTIGLFEEETLPQAIEQLDVTFDGCIKEVLSSNDFKGKDEELLLLHPKENPITKRVLLIGLGKSKECNLEGIRRAAGRASDYSCKLKVKELSFLLRSFSLSSLDSSQLARALVEASLLASYRFDKFKEKRDKAKIETIRLWDFEGKKDAEGLRKGGVLGKIIAEETCYARDLVFLPGNCATPELLAEEIKKGISDLPITCSLLTPRDMEKLGMEAILAVGKGSENPPRLIILEYNPKNARGKPVLLVGKGVTFDAGGISLKPSREMWEMKSDMAGGAAVVSAVKVAARLKIPRRIIAIVPAAENLPSGRATRPGDVVRSYSGKTIEIIDTDAEGRLLLADALAYGKDVYKPGMMIDLATLTGACIIALGNHAAGMLGNDKELKDELRRAGERTYERVWELPLWKEYKEEMKSDIADVKNLGGREGGAITAAAFLSEFVGDTPWVHLDIAGVAWTKEKKPYIPKGATGFGVRLLSEFLLNLKG